MIFANTKAMCTDLQREVSHAGFRCTSLHSGKSQPEREQAIDAIKSRRCDMLICTSVASRGLDIASVALVLNYDMALTIEDYTHRIGRTGRAGASGRALSFMTPSDSHLFPQLRMLIKRMGGRVPKEMQQVVNFGGESMAAAEDEL